MDSILTITSAASTHDLTVIATAKLELGLSDASQDDELQRLITEASDQIAAYCNTVFAKQSYSEVFRRVRCRDRLLLSRTPVDTITSVTVDGSALEAAEYEVDAESGILYRLESDDRYVWSGDKITVAYSAGYTLLTDLPYTVERACLDLVKRRYYAKTRDPSLRSLDIPDVGREDYWGGASLEIIGGLPADIARSLDAFRAYSFG